MKKKKSEPKTYTLGAKRIRRTIEDRDGRLYEVRDSRLVVDFKPTVESIQEQFPIYHWMLYILPEEE
jgi:hypothetical protein